MGYAVVYSLCSDNNDFAFFSLEWGMGYNGASRIALTLFKTHFAQFRRNGLFFPSGILPRRGGSSRGVRIYLIVYAENKCAIF